MAGPNRQLGQWRPSQSGSVACRDPEPRAGVCAGPARATRRRRRTRPATSPGFPGFLGFLGPTPILASRPRSKACTCPKVGSGAASSGTATTTRCRATRRNCARARADTSAGRCSRTWTASTVSTASSATGRASRSAAANRARLPRRAGDAAGQRDGRRDEVGADDPQSRVPVGGQQREEAEAAPDVQDGRAADQRQDVVVDAGERGDAAGPAMIRATQPPHGVAVKEVPRLRRVGMGRLDRVDEDPLERRTVRHQPERPEFGGDVTGELVADLVTSQPWPDAPLVNKKMRRDD